MFWIPGQSLLLNAMYHNKINGRAEVRLNFNETIFGMLIFLFA